jgi:ubiquinone biosynthesis protein UbiJ
MTTQPSTAFLPLLLRRSRAMLNRWIAGSSAATEELRQLEGRSMVIVVDKLERAVMLAAEQRQLRLREVAVDATTDVLVRASLFDLLALLRADDPTRVSAGEIEFRGSLAVAERFTRMLRLARPTPEDELAGWVGDLPARVIARGGEAAFAWGRRTAGALERDVAEYLQAETRELPRPSELTDYFRDVERLRDDVDRMNQRVARLSARLRTETSR